MNEVALKILRRMGGLQLIFLFLFLLTLRLVTIEPLPFHVKFVPRSARHAEIVKRDFEQVSEFLAKWD